MRVHYNGFQLSRVDEQNEGVDYNNQSSCDEETPFLDRDAGNVGQASESFEYSSDGESKSQRGGTSTTETLTDEWLSSSPEKRYKTFPRDVDFGETKDLSRILRKEAKKKKKKKSRREHEKEKLLRLYSTLEKEREVLMEKWKEEFRQEQSQKSSCFTKIQLYFSNKVALFSMGVKDTLFSAEAFVCNLPLTVGAIAIAWVTMGVDWWKYTEETLSSCTPVHFRSPHCTFPEFPGCFECVDKEDIYYRTALYFHYFCDSFAALLLLGFAAKVVLAWEIVADELSNPTTSTPCGLVLITTCIIAAGQGPIGEIFVLAASLVHLVLYGWFFFMAFKYRMLPDPSWGPNTVGICYPAVKTWLYNGIAGHCLMALCLLSFVVTFPIRYVIESDNTEFALENFFTHTLVRMVACSILRAWLNRKMSAIVAWIQMSGPAVTLYALTLMTQPTNYHRQVVIESDPVAAMEYHTWQLKHIMPIFHGLFVCCIIGSISSLVGLIVRWETFRHNAFSPAHAAFCFPILSHANAVQAYRGVINSILQLPPDHWYLRFVYCYWLMFLIPGSIVTITITARFMYNLPAWTLPNLEAEIEPPAPNATIVSDVLMTGDAIRQPFVSPTVLQANETGVLMRVRRDNAGFATKGRYIRTLMVSSLGFEPKLDPSTVESEREELLNWVAKHPPRPRHNRISSNPAKLYGTFLGRQNRAFDNDEAAHRRSITLF